MGCKENYKLLLQLSFIGVWRGCTERRVQGKKTEGSRETKVGYAVKEWLPLAPQYRVATNEARVFPSRQFFPKAILNGAG